MIRHIQLCILTVFLIVLNATAQISEVAIPYSATYRLDPIKEFTSMPSFDRVKMAQEDEEISSRLKKHRFAKMFQVTLSPENSGNWDETEEGRVWRLGIRSSGAYSLYEVFGGFKLSPGVKLFVYNSERTDFAGAFTSKNNNSANVLSIAPVSGESIIIELNIPSGTNYGELVLTQVGHDYNNEFGDKLKYDYKYELSESCHIDVNCPQGAKWQTEKNAVCRVLINGALCTGTLINNIAGKKIPYLITACHCVSDSASAATSLFFFGYEKEVCRVPDSEKAFLLSGAQLMATTNRLLDFTLLKLNQYPPAYYNPYFAGFDADSVPPQGGVCIHHPGGDVKKISTYNKPLTSGDFGEGFNLYSHWLVPRWESGSTQGGSSGAPFFNTSHLLCGTLTGGDSKCSNPINDFFLKMHRSWDEYPDSSRQLKYWLDPERTGKTKVEGIYPYGQPQNSKNVYTNAKGEFCTTYKNKLTNGTIAGHNSARFYYFAEKFYAPSPIQLSGMYLRIAERYNTDLFSLFTLKVWEGTNKPLKEKYSQNVYLVTLLNNAANYFNFDSLVTVSDTFFVGYYINYLFPDTLAACTAIDRGLNGSSTMYINNGGAWHNINEITSPKINTALILGVISPNGIDPTLKVRRSFKIAPNPCSDFVRIEFSDDMAPLSFECYDITGHRFSLNYAKTDIGFRLNTSNLPTGVYFLVIQSKTEKRIEKFVIIRNTF